MIFVYSSWDLYIYISLTATIPTSKIQPFFPFYRKRIRELTLDKRAARTHLIDLAWRDRIGHGWNFEIASLPGQSPYDRSSWSWKQWQGPEARSSTHRQWHTRTLLFFPTHLLACMFSKIHNINTNHIEKNSEKNFFIVQFFVALFF